MGVYIPNMSKPKDCYLCEYTNGYECWSNGEPWFDVKEAYAKGTLSPNCPIIEIDLEKDIPTVWYNRQTGQFEPKGTKQEVYKRIYKLQNGGRGADDYTIKANK